MMNDKNNIGVYLSLRQDDSFHTLMIKKEIDDNVYFVVVGYSGGGVYSEFYSKLKYNNDLEITGFLSQSIGSREWEEEILSLDFDKKKEQFNLQTRAFYELMNDTDTIIQNEMSNFIKKYIYYLYDEETNKDYEQPILKNIDLSEFQKNPNSNQFSNKEWNDSFLELTISNYWGLSLSFPQIIYNYL